MLTMTEFITRHDDILSIVQVVDDPIYLDEPYVLSITYTYDPNGGRRRRTAAARRLPRTADAIVMSAALPAGAEQRHRRVHQDAELDPLRADPRRREDDLSRVPRRDERRHDAGQPHGAGIEECQRRRQADRRQSPRDGQVHVLPVQGNIYMLVADGTNITASVGRDGIAVVNTGSRRCPTRCSRRSTKLAKTRSAPRPNTCFGANCPGVAGWSSPYFNA
jgi:hypothetical protein